MTHRSCSCSSRAGSQTPAAHILHACCREQQHTNTTACMLSRISPAVCSTQASQWVHVLPAAAHPSCTSAVLPRGPVAPTADVLHPLSILLDLPLSP
jgi:hypothetical protein